MQIKSKYKDYLKIILIILLLGWIFVNGNESNNPQKLAERTLSKCSHIESRGIDLENCYGQELGNIAYRKSGDLAFKTLAELQKIDPSTEGCHLIAHGIGQGIYKSDPANWQNEIQTVAQSCSYGAIHGIIESYINSLPTGNLTKEILPSICGENPKNNCNHILGHLLLVETSGDIGKALEMCSPLKDYYQHHDCTRGVFMENITALNLMAHGLADKSWLNWGERLPKLEKLCRKAKDDFGVSCWTEIVHAALVKFQYNPGDTFEFCSKSETIKEAKACRRHGVGIITSRDFSNLLGLKDMCQIKQHNDPEFENDCYKDIAYEVIAAVPSKTREVTEFCNSLDQKFQADCFQQIPAGNDVLTPKND